MKIGSDLMIKMLKKEIIKLKRTNKSIQYRKSENETNDYL